MSKEMPLTIAEVGCPGSKRVSPTGIPNFSQGTIFAYERVAVIEPIETGHYEDANNYWENVLKKSEITCLRANIYKELPHLRCGLVVLENVVNDPAYRRKNFSHLAENLAKITASDGTVLFVHSVGKNSDYFKLYDELIRAMEELFDLSLDDCHAGIYANPSRKQVRKTLIREIGSMFPGDVSLLKGLVSRLNDYGRWISFRKRATTDIAS